MVPGPSLAVNSWASYSAVTPEVGIDMWNVMVAAPVVVTVPYQIS